MPALTNGSLPAPASAAVLDGLVRLGFEQNAVLKDYVFSIGEGHTAQADLLAFADATRRTPADYAAISARHRPDAQDPRETVETLAQSGALFHLLHHADAFQLWTSEFDPQRQKPTARPLLDSIAYERLPEALEGFGADLSPERIVGVKQGREWFAHESLRSLAGQQMTLWVMDVNRPLLRDHFEAAVRTLRAAQDRTRAWSDDETTRMAVQLLGAVVLADTGALQDFVRINRNLSLERLWAEGQRWFRPYFHPILPAAREAAESALSILRGISYAGFQPEMLVELYTAAYRDEQRKELGRYDTPMHLTRAIWDHVPIELLPPEDRLVCDLSSGWGSFLIAGYERLTRLGDMRGRAMNRHLVGNDMDASTALLARFGLLISTGHDSWRVDAEDALRWRWLDEARPNVIVGNPAFGENRKKGRPTSSDGLVAERTQRAATFLERAVETVAPDGFVAMVLPLSLMTAQAGSRVRERIYQDCDLLDLWEVANGMFAEADVATSVAFLRKRPVSARSTTAVSIRTIQTAHLPAFREDGTFTATQVVPAGDLWTDIPGPRTTRKMRYRLSYSLILPPNEWRALRARCVRLDERAEIFGGCIPGVYEETSSGKDVTPVQVPYLPNFRSAVTVPFQISYAAAETRVYPTDFIRPRLASRELLSQPKVVINSISKPIWGRRIKAAVDHRGYYISDHFWGLIPSHDGRLAGITLEALAAVTSWYVANGWIVGALRVPKIPKQAIDSIPFPAELTATAIRDLTEAVGTLEKAPPGSALAEAAQALIDERLQEAYGIDDETLNRLRYVTRFSGQHGPPAPRPVTLNSPWLLDGVVERVSSEDGILTLWLNGFDTLQTVAFQPDMPAWLLREGVPFRTSVSQSAWDERQLGADPRFGPFSVAPYAYLDEEAALARLGVLAEEIPE